MRQSSSRWLPMVLLIASIARGQDRPNVLVILADDHSAPHLGCYGNADIRTPNLDRFAAEGMRLDRYYVMCPQCVPSRATLMTGRATIDLQMTRFSAPLPRDIPTWLELLRAGGAYVGVAGRNFHLDGAANSPESRAVFDEHKLQTFADRLDFAKVGGRGQMLAQFREFLDGVPSGKPFALQLCSNDPHRPLDADAIPTPHDPATIKLPAHYPDTPAIRADFARYYDEISRFDGDVGTILAELDRRGLAGNTLVLVSGDNGASQFRGKGTLYEFGIHVPLLARWPGKIGAGTHHDHLLSGEDVAPTLLEAAGASAPPEMTGRSFYPLLVGAAYQPREHVFAARGAHGSALPNSTAAFDLSRCAVSKKYKFIYNPLWQLPYTPVDFNNDLMWKNLRTMHEAGQLSPELSARYFAPTRPMFELYDLEADPAELVNLVDRPEAAEALQAMKAALHEWMILQRDFVPLPIAGEPAGRRR